MIAISNAISIGLNKVGGGSTPGYDPDAQAFFARVTAAGGTLSVTEEQAVNQLVLYSKAQGLWTLIDAAYPMVGSSAAAFAQNLKSSAFTGTFTSGWTYASTGATPNGAAYMDTSYNVDVSGQLNDAHLSFYSRSIGVTSGANMGCYQAPSSFHHVYSKWIDNKAYCGVNGSESSLSNPDSQGFYIGARINASQQKYYKNGSVFITGSVVSTIKPPRNIYVGASNGSAGIDYSTMELAWASFGKGMTDTQASNFYTAIQAFQTTLNRQIAG